MCARAFSLSVHVCIHIFQVAVSQCTILSANIYTHTHTHVRAEWLVCGGNLAGMRQQPFDSYTVYSFVTKSAGATHRTTKTKCLSLRTIWVWIKMISMLKKLDKKPATESSYSLICLFINIECICISVPIQSQIFEYAFKAAFHGWLCVSFTIETTSFAYIGTMLISWICCSTVVYMDTAVCAYEFPNEREKAKIFLSYSKQV